MEVKRSQILSLPIDNESDAGVCRRKSVALAKEIGFNEVKAGELAIISTELVTNVMKHGGGKGKIIICCMVDDLDNKGIEIWCCDSGNGIANFKEALQDGYSAANTLGVGLGSIRRFSDELEINPKCNGTLKEFYFDDHMISQNCIRSRKWLPKKQWFGNHRELEIGAVSRSKPGETLNGDTYVVTHVNTHLSVIAVIDGLGHGKEAHFASQLAREQIIRKAELPPASLMESIHQAIKGTRGCVIGLAYINTQSNKISFSGIGNIESFLFNNKEKKTLLSFGGIMGHNMRTPRVFESDFNKGDSICMYSDGINTRWKIEDLDSNLSAQQKAESVLNQFSRNNDDATILFVRYSS